MLPSHRICKDEVISDHQREVKKIKEVKLFNSRTSGLHEQTESFLMVSYRGIYRIEGFFFF